MKKPQNPKQREDHRFNGTTTAATLGKILRLLAEWVEKDGRMVRFDVRAVQE